MYKIPEKLNDSKTNLCFIKAMSEADNDWVPELDELINNVDKLRSDFKELHSTCSEIKEMCAEFLQKNNVVNNKEHEKIPLHRKHKRKQNRNQLDWGAGQCNK